MPWSGPPSYRFTQDYGVTTQSGIHEVEPPLNAIQPALDTVQPSGLACYRLFDCRHPVLDVAHVINEPVDLGINSAQVAQNTAFAAPKHPEPDPVISS